MTGAIVVRLYVAGDTPPSRRALAALRALAAELGAALELEVIDVLAEPLRGLADGIVATPTVVRADPPPPRRMFGAPRDRASLVDALGLP